MKRLSDRIMDDYESLTPREFNKKMRAYIDEIRLLEHFYDLTIKERNLERKMNLHYQAVINRNT